MKITDTAYTLERAFPHGYDARSNATCVVTQYHTALCFAFSVTVENEPAGFGSIREYFATLREAITEADIRLAKLRAYATSRRYHDREAREHMLGVYAVRVPNARGEG